MYFVVASPAIRIVDLQQRQRKEGRKEGSRDVRGEEVVIGLREAGGREEAQIKNMTINVLLLLMLLVVYNCGW